MDVNKEKVDNFFTAVIGMILFILLLPAVIVFYLGAVVYFFLPFKLVVGLFFALVSLLLIVVAKASGSGYLVLSILATILFSVVFLFFPASDITIELQDIMEETRTAIQYSVDSSDDVFSIVRVQATEIPKRMLSGLKENIKEFSARK